METIRSDDGKKRFCINGDESRIIEFRPADFNLLPRLHKAQEEINKALAKLPDNLGMSFDIENPDSIAEHANYIETLDNEIKEQVNYIFDSDVSMAVFGNSSALTLVNGKFYLEVFLEAVSPILEREIQKEMEKSNKRMAKHTKKYDKPKRKLSKEFIGDE